MKNKFQKLLPCSRPELYQANSENQKLTYNFFPCDGTLGLDSESFLRPEMWECTDTRKLAPQKLAMQRHFCWTPSMPIQLRSTQSVDLSGGETSCANDNIPLAKLLNADTQCLATNAPSSHVYANRAVSDQ
eukprot:3285826-Amphidinium_carterae.1